MTVSTNDNPRWLCIGPAVIGAAGIGDLADGHSSFGMKPADSVFAYTLPRS